MECNVCGSSAKSVEITYRHVTFKTSHCLCGKARREVTTTLTTEDEMQHDISSMLQMNSTAPSNIRAAAIDFLQRHILKFKPERTMQERRHDLWERRFLREQLHEDFAI